VGWLSEEGKVVHVDAMAIVPDLDLVNGTG
jgi:hypothetical protein